jgi:hypothetical protein
MWFSLTGEAKMPTQRQMLTALDAALSAQVNLLFSKMASAASGADPERRFAKGIKNASSFYDKAADIIRNVVQERQAALAQPRRRRRQARTSWTGAKWLELLKDIVPQVARVAVLYGPRNPGGLPMFTAIQVVAPSLRVELISVLKSRPRCSPAPTRWSNDVKGGSKWNFPAEIFSI